MPGRVDHARTGRSGQECQGQECQGQECHGRAWSIMQAWSIIQGLVHHAGPGPSRPGPSRPGTLHGLVHYMARYTTWPGTPDPVTQGYTRPPSTARTRSTPPARRPSPRLPYLSSILRLLDSHLPFTVEINLPILTHYWLIIDSLLTLSLDTLLLAIYS